MATKRSKTKGLESKCNWKQYVKNLKDPMVFATFLAMVIGINTVMYILPFINSLFSIMMISKHLLIPSIVLYVSVVGFSFYVVRGFCSRSIMKLKTCITAMTILMLVDLSTYVYLEGEIAIDNYVNVSEYAIMKYYEDSSKTVGMDTIQTTFHCCGVYSIEDWQKNKHFKCEKKFSNHECTVPTSCCITKLQVETESEICTVKLVNGVVDKELNTHVYTKGCLPFIQNFLLNASERIFYGLYFLCTAELLAVMAATFILRVQRRNRKK